jgi:glutathione peroxidase
MRSRHSGAAVIAILIISLSVVLLRGDETKKEAKPVPPVLNFTMKSLSGDDVKLSRYQGKVVLIVNTASKCGYTSQYADLQVVHEKYNGRGLVVLGFPSNDFGGQEPGTDQQIAEFCGKNYGVTFDMFSKVVVKGPEKVPLFKHLTESQSDPNLNGEIKWNFEKFLVSRDGQVVARFRSKAKPTSDEMIRAVEAELAK